MENSREDCEKTKQVQAPTLVNILTENNRIINECLLISNDLYKLLTTDNYLKEQNEINVDCIMQDVMTQNEKLSMLLKILKSINSNIND